MKNKRIPLGCLGILIVGIVGLFGAYAAIGVWPSLGAQAADRLRSVLGDEAVAQMETIAFEAKDSYQRWKYSVGLEHPAAPWQETAPTAATAEVTPEPTVLPTPVEVIMPDRGPEIRPISRPAPEARAWLPSEVISPLGTLKGEGIWTPYLHDPSGQVVAYRTFLQPDKDRPYSVVAVVAFDLARTRLHYVLGSEEPSLPRGPHGTGKIAPEYRAPGVLLSTFNGGFKATHGQFGAMADGVIALPPREGLGAVAIYNSGRVRIGEWGTDFITQTKTMVAWRENAPLIVKNGQPSRRVFSNQISDWGATIDGNIITWRSAMGQNEKGDTLYYFAGPSLSMPALARAMIAVGTYQGMLLDINPFWVHFAAVRAEGNKLAADPLLPEMNQQKDRYLNAYSRDFFYVTAGEQVSCCSDPAVNKVHTHD
jgi:hypothetical protein